MGRSLLKFRTYSCAAVRVNLKIFQRKLTLFLAITEDQLEQLRDARDIDRIMVLNSYLFVINLIIF